MFAIIAESERRSSQPVKMADDGNPAHGDPAGLHPSTLPRAQRRIDDPAVRLDIISRVIPRRPDSGISAVV